MSSDASVIWESLVQERVKSESLVRERCSSELPEEERFIRVKFVRRSLLADEFFGAADSEACELQKWDVVRSIMGLLSRLDKPPPSGQLEGPQPAAVGSCV